MDKKPHSKLLIETKGLEVQTVMGSNGVDKGRVAYMQANYMSNEEKAFVSGVA